MCGKLNFSSVSIAAIVCTIKCRLPRSLYNSSRVVELARGQLAKSRDFLFYIFLLFSHLIFQTIKKRMVQASSTSNGIIIEKNNDDDGNAKNRSSKSVDINDNEEELPNNVCTEQQLSSLPIVCLNQNSKTNKERPLRHVDEHGNVHTYALRPMFYSVIFILMVELLERFCFYGLNYTMTSFLTGAYDDRKEKKAHLQSFERWDADMSAISASSMVSISTAVAYSTPFVGAILADCYLGDYKAMVVGSICFYLPGLLVSYAMPFYSLLCKN